MTENPKTAPADGTTAETAQRIPGQADLAGQGDNARVGEVVEEISE